MLAKAPIQVGSPCWTSSHSATSRSLKKSTRSLPSKSNRDWGNENERFDVEGEHSGLDTTAYRALNPNRRIPTLDDHGFTLWESNVIVRCLAAKYDAGNLWPTAFDARAVADQWMDWQQTTVLSDMRTLFFGLIPQPLGHAAERTAVYHTATVHR